jgi:hypothetical protein
MIGHKMEYFKQQNEMVEYITTLLNINSGNSFVITDMIEELTKLKDLSTFKEFMKDEIKKPTYTNYSNGFQKFLKICEAYQSTNAVTLDDAELRKVYTYADKLFSKTTSVFDEINYQVSIGQDINSKQMTNFIYANLDDNDRKVLKLIGDRHRLLFMIRHSRGELQEQISKTVSDLSTERKKAVLGVSMAQKSDNENRMLILVNGK